MGGGERVSVAVLIQPPRLHLCKTLLSRNNSLRASLSFTFAELFLLPRLEAVGEELRAAMIKRGGGSRSVVMLDSAETLQTVIFHP